MTSSKCISDQEIGRRLRIARQNANRIANEVAEVTGLPLATIISFELGERIVPIDELKTLTKFYELTVNALLRPDDVHVNIIPRFRSFRKSHSQAIMDAARHLND